MIMRLSDKLRGTPARPSQGRRAQASTPGWPAALFQGARAVIDTSVETLWPTRCAVCDAPGEPLCPACLRALPYIDPWHACPVCGAPFGLVQCSECNDVILAAHGRTCIPLDGMASAIAFSEESGRIVRCWKDGGERRLAETMGALMARTVSPAWLAQELSVVPIPATEAALRRRGFDHGRELGRAVAMALNVPLADLLERPRSRDQRELGREGRVKNLEGRFHARALALAPRAALLVDDVCTTGSTLFGACDALRAAGVERVYGLTFARVW